MRVVGLPRVYEISTCRFELTAAASTSPYQKLPRRRSAPPRNRPSPGDAYGISGTQTSVVEIGAVPSLPPAMKMEPLTSRVAVWPALAVNKGPVNVRVSISGSNTSADSSRLPDANVPPATRNRVRGRIVVVEHALSVARETTDRPGSSRPANDWTYPSHAVPSTTSRRGTIVHCPLAGSYASASTTLPSGLRAPPVTSTRPSLRRTATWNCRAAFIDEVGTHALDAGSKSTAELDTRPHGVPPPETRMRWSASRTAAGP